MVHSTELSIVKSCQCFSQFLYTFWRQLCMQRQPSSPVPWAAGRTIKIAQMKTECEGYNRHAQGKLLLKHRTWPDPRNDRWSYRNSSPTSWYKDAEINNRKLGEQQGLQPLFQSCTQHKVMALKGLQPPSILLQQGQLGNYVTMMFGNVEGHMSGECYNYCSCSVSVAKKHQKWTGN